MKFNEKQMMGRFGNTSMRTNRIPRLTDKTGLDKAYDSQEKLHVQGDTLYVAGTSNVRDAWDDLKIPFGKTANAKRYQDADKLLEKNPQVSKLVGHSLGGSSVLELQKNHPERTFKTNTYGAPVVSITAPDNVDNHRYRNYGDPVSLLDRGAETSTKQSAGEHYTEAFKNKNPLEFWSGILDAHSYDNFKQTQVGGGTAERSSDDIS
jgi:hypothetical protein